MSGGAFIMNGADDFAAHKSEDKKFLSSNMLGVKLSAASRIEII